MDNLEFYDGEERTYYWWRTIISNSIIMAIFSSIAFVFIFILIKGFPNEKRIITLISSFSLGILLLTFLFVISFSMIFSRFAWCLFYWNITLAILIPILVSSVTYGILISIKDSIYRGTKEGFLISIVVGVIFWIISVVVKTIILYYRGWRIVSWG